jgi:hypothetical protein
MFDDNGQPKPAQAKSSRVLGGFLTPRRRLAAATRRRFEKGEVVGEVATYARVARPEE